ncbi:hypothetical protein FA15DRAFT_455881 [Coprinopsis marcescibilis]|uniref:Uncharacterized protein n=1 Tax=Coprinopsis marcescibilis TaxID=230819 RepID=A0A5C3L8L2_COPMA|nr:hypothetical protein FA15DRAFT_455881 [Coprinopsis marcescibilis]
MGPTTASPPDSGFTPRKEFLKDDSPRNSFALLAISSSNFIRLYSFTPTVVASFERLFEAQGIAVAAREDQPHNLYEFSLDGKPWANSKSVHTEKLLIDIFTIIYQAGYTFLSCIDYGREHDDRLAMAFSKPAATPAASRTGTPLPTGGGSPSLAADGKTQRRLPFALSFASTTVMRVIAPPLHLTPAILQAVRNSWPRGVVSEKKVGDNCYEFQLKGYKWFQQDNFASDSLQLILTLLSSLDRHSFSLLTSISLTNNRSRVKDLWVFTGPASESIDNVHTSTSNLELSISQDLPERPTTPRGQASLQHRRQVSEPLALPTPSGPATGLSHTRSATEDMRHINPPQTPTTISQGPHLLRKPAPRAQVPVSVIQEQDDVVNEYEGEPPTYQYNRANLPSVVSSNDDNMTGVGTMKHQRNESPLVPSFSAHLSQRERPRTPPVAPLTNSQPATPIHQRFATTGQYSGSGNVNKSNSQSRHGSPSRAPPRSQPSPQPAVHVIPPLLSGDPFKDKDSPDRDNDDDGSEGYPRTSGAESSDISGEVPIKWTGGGGQSGLGRKQEHSPNQTQAKKVLPGGWLSPTDEEASPAGNKGAGGSYFSASPSKGAGKNGLGTATTPIRETRGLVESPEIVNPWARQPKDGSTGNLSNPEGLDALRKSEAALVGVIAATNVPPMPSTMFSPSSRSSSNGSRGSGQKGNTNPKTTSSSSLGSSKENSQTRDRTTSNRLVKPNIHQSAGAAGSGQGWVLVNVEGSPHATPNPSSSRHGTPQMAPAIPAFVSGSGLVEGNMSTSPPLSPPATPATAPEVQAQTQPITTGGAPLAAATSPSQAQIAAEVKAKAIVTIDALDSRSHSREGEHTGSASNSKIRRFFSLNKKSSVNCCCCKAEET